MISFQLVSGNDFFVMFVTFFSLQHEKLVSVIANLLKQLTKMFAALNSKFYFKVNNKLHVHLG